MTRLELEIAIDHHGLCSVLDAIAEICNEKSDHIVSTYGAALISGDWLDAAKSINMASVKCKETIGRLSYRPTKES